MFMKMKNNWTFLSYVLSLELSGYRDGRRVEIETISQVKNGDSSNSTSLNMSCHNGTHIDYPFHSLSEGKKSTDYTLGFYMSDKVVFVDLTPIKENQLITESDLSVVLEPNSETEILIIKTGFTHKRYEESYWKWNSSFDTGVASFLKKIYPKLRIVGFDQISLTTYKYRDVGRLVHKEFFDMDILPVEDMDLTPIASRDKISQIIISPLRIKDNDAAPVTVFAQINKEND